MANKPVSIATGTVSMATTHLMVTYMADFPFAMARGVQHYTIT